MHILKPSLEHIALIKIATVLWNQDDVKNSLSKFFIPYRYSELNADWVRIEDIAAKKVAKLPLAKQMKEKVLCIMRPIGFEILKWKHFHKRICNLSIGLPNEFYWTPQGTIDRKKTAEAMINDLNIDITTRYKLACIYCFQDDIPKLWEEIDDSSRKYFYNQEDAEHVEQKELVVLWTYAIKDELNKMKKVIQTRMGRSCFACRYGLEVAVSDGNRVATEYFLQRLNVLTREQSLISTAVSVAFEHSTFFNICRKEDNSDILCFLFSELNEEEKIEVLEYFPEQFLTCFLNWPNQAFFMEASACMWNFLDKNIYGKLLLNIVGKVKNGYKDFNYQKLFQEFWKQSPRNNKRHVVSVRSGLLLPIVSGLFQIKDVSNIRLIFQDASPEEKKYLIYDERGLICRNLMNHENQLSLLKFFIKECLPSEDQVIEFKHAFEKNLVEVSFFYDRYKFHGVLDEIICEFKKRKCAEDESS